MGSLEAVDYIDGVQRRSRTAYEVMRFLANVIYKSNGGKRDLKIEYAWDDDREGDGERKPLKSEELELLQQEARAYAQKMNKR